MPIDFDLDDFSVSDDPNGHPDEVILPAHDVSSHHFEQNRNQNANAGLRTDGQNVKSNASRPIQRAQSMAAPSRPQNGPHGADLGIASAAPLPQPQTPNGGLNRSNSGAGQVRPPIDPVLGRPPQATGPAQGRVLNQPSRNGINSGPPSPKQQARGASEDTSQAGIPPASVGFYSARGTINLQQPEDPTAPLPPLTGNLPAFNPNAESPSIRKTPGIDHRSSKPLTRDGKHVPGSTQPSVTAAAVPTRTNLMNPHLDQTRRIGAPGSPSPMTGMNRGGFKQPTFQKRTVESRVPLEDMPVNVSAEGGDVKRQKVSGP
jgi:DNA repair and recombination protein RAD52